MSRSGYTDDCDSSLINLYRANVEKSVRGNRGQSFLREMAAVLDAMPVKELIAGDLVTETGEVCALGAVCKARKLDVSDVDIDCSEDVGELLGISRSMAAEIVYENDEGSFWDFESNEQRWKRMRKWVDQHLVQGKN